MSNSAFAFYLFGYQVHEKSILLPLLPVTLLAASEPLLAAALPLLAAFSMWPLLSRDGLVIAYIAMIILFAPFVYQQLPEPPLALVASGSVDQSTSYLKFLLIKHGPTVSVWGAILIHALTQIIPTSARYPYLHDAAFTTYAFAHFFPICGYLNWRQWNQDRLYK